MTYDVYYYTYATWAWVKDSTHATEAEARQSAASCRRGAFLDHRAVVMPGDPNIAIGTHRAEVRPC